MGVESFFETAYFGKYGSMALEISEYLKVVIPRVLHSDFDIRHSSSPPPQYRPE